MGVGFTASSLAMTAPVHFPERRRVAPIRYTRLPWPHPTLLAPMEGITNPTFRAHIAALGGLGVACTEFVRVTDHPVSRKSLSKHVERSSSVPLCVQVMGNRPERLHDAAAMMARAGADVVDLNLGCPAPRVVRKGAGSAMLKDPVLLYDVVSRMREAVPGPLSAKIRAGFDQKTHVVKIARTLEAAGVDWIAVHPRRRADFYDGVADWRIIRLLVQNLDIPVIGNGDVWYAADALRMRRETGCDAVMIGRPAMRNPYIFRQIDELERTGQARPVSGQQLFDWVVGLMRDLERFHRGSKRGPVGKLKELLTYFARAIPDGGVTRKKALRIQTTDGILRFLEHELATRPAECLDLWPASRYALERSGSVAEQRDVPTSNVA